MNDSRVKIIGNTLIVLSDEYTTNYKDRTIQLKRLQLRYPETRLVYQINQCTDKQINDILKLGYINEDEFQYLSKREAIKIFIESEADINEMKQIKKIINTRR